MRRIPRSQFIKRSDFPFHITRGRLSVERYPAHSHDFSELVIILAGAALHATGGREYPIAAGDVFLLQGSRSHAFRRARDLDIVNIMYDPAILEPTAPLLKKIPGYHALFILEPRYRPRHEFQSRLRLDPDDIPHVASSICDIKQEFDEARTWYEAAILSQFLALTTFLARRYGGIASPSGQALLRVGEVIAHLERHYRQPQSLADLAKLAHMSPNHLIRVFKDATGAAPIEYLIRYRVARAAEQLGRSDLNITQIALDTGFPDGNYFARQFRRIMGLSPRQHRQRMR